MTRHVISQYRIVLVTGLTMALTGCGGAGPGEEEYSQGADQGIMHEIHSSPQPIRIQEWDETVAAEAEETARDAATAYARPDLSETDWFIQLAPYLSTEAQGTFREVSNTNIAATAVVDVHPAVPGASPAIAAVDVETNAGPLQFLLSRDADTWVVERITSTSQGESTPGE